MSDLYLDKYRVGSIRKKGHDYTSPGVYFITITTDAKINWFGSIKKGKMRLSPIGEIVREEWLKSEIVRENIQLDEWIIIPNHIHGIIIINERSVETARWAVSSTIKNKTVSPNIKDKAVSPINKDKAISPHIKNKVVSSNINNNDHNIKINDNRYRTIALKPNSIGSIIGQFKSICTKRIRNKGFKYFKWQNRYYDHIVKNEKELNKIRFYIKTNPIRWRF